MADARLHQNCRAGEYCLEFHEGIQTLLPQLKGGCDNLFDLAIIENSGTCDDSSRMRENRSGSAVHRLN